MKAPFFKRLFAYVIDILIISILTTIICSAIPSKIQDTEKQLRELSTELMEKKIEADEYISRYKELMYENNKNEKVTSCVTLVLTLAYFVIFQYLNKGQTIAKKLLHLRVVDKDSKKEISILKGFLRSLLPLSILSNAISVTLIKVLSKNIYINTYLAVSEIETIFIFVTIFLIIYRKDGRGLHDMISNTMVIEEKR